MSTVRIPQLPQVSGLDGTEEMEVAQSDGLGGFVSRRTTVGAIASAGSPSGVAPGSYGDATHVGAFTVDIFGHLIAASNIAIGSGGIGTVTNVSVVSANGFAGSVALSTTTPQITISTTVTGILVGDGTAVTGLSTTGTGNVVLQTSPVLITPTIGAAIGTSLQLSGLTASSAVATDAGKNLVSVTNTGTGNKVLATSPVLVTPTLGVATATSLNKITITQPATGATLTIQDGFTLTVSGNAIVIGNNTGDQTITLTGDVTGTGTSTFITTIPAQTITFAKMQNIATATFVGRATAGTGSPESLTGSAATALLSVMVGDSGSGGTKGLVPAAPAGSAAAGEFLKADGTFAVPAGTGAGTVNSVAVATANGFAGTVASPTANPVITLTTTITGILSGNGTAISAAATTGSGSVVLATSPTLVTPALGTPTAIVLTNGTGLPISSGVSGLGTGIATFLATPTSANLAAALTDETGTGLAVFNTSPTLVTPALGVAVATTINKVTITAPATAATLTLADGTTVTGPPSTGTLATLALAETLSNKTLSSPTIAKIGNLTSNGLVTTSAGDGTLSITAMATGIATFLGTPSSANLAAAVTDETGTGALVFATSPTLVTPALGTPASGVATNLTGTASGLTSGITNALASATTTVNVSSATAPSANQVLTATDSTHATWQTPTGGNITFVHATADQTVASQTTLQNATSLSLTVAANTYYGFRFVIKFRISTTNNIGVKVGVTVPASPTQFIASASMVGVATAFLAGASVTSGGAIIAASATATDDVTVVIEGILNNGANSGTIQLQFAQNASSGNGTTLRAGSYGQLNSL